MTWPVTKDKVGKPTNYQEWMLDSCIKVGSELNWSTESARDVADILKEYRNFIHPAKELWPAAGSVDCCASRGGEP